MGPNAPGWTPMLGIVFLTVIRLAHQQEPCDILPKTNSQCQFLTSCPSIRNAVGAYTSTSSQLMKQKLKDFISKSYRLCSDVVKGKRFCCPVSKKSNSVHKPLQPQQIHKQSLDLLPSDCGQKKYTTDRITGGKDARLGSWPWIALLDIVGNSMCGGTLINDRYVVTAAHCMIAHINYVILGEHNLDRDMDCDKINGRTVCAPPVQKIPPEEIIPHPDYGRHCLFCNDIGIIRLSRRAEINGFVSPICLPLNPPSDLGFSFDNFDALHGQAAGWGHDNSNIAPNRVTFSRPSVLQEVLLEVHDLQFCREQKARFTHPDSIFCAGGGSSGNKDTCNGDSGGPFTLNYQKRIYYLVGLTSYGLSGRCGNPSNQGVFTKVYYFKDWILSNMKP